MLDKLMSNTVGLVQTNLNLIGSSYPVTLISDRVSNFLGSREEEADTFDDASGISNTNSSSDYISIYSMIDRSIQGERFPWYRWLLFGIGLFLMIITISMVTNHMIMLPVALRLFVILYLLNIGLFTDFTGLNMIYYILLTYAGICLYRVYLRTTDPTITIMPFHWNSFLPLRTAKNNWTDFWTPLFYMGRYLPTGASGYKYTHVVEDTQTYIDSLKATIPDYKELEGTFNLKPLYDTFENHMIDVNLPGFIPESSNINLSDAKTAISLSKAEQKIATAVSVKSVAQKSLPS